MERVILVNKPRGISSAAVVARIKKKFPKQKVGHAGTLDPLAEGLLIILVGKATKRQEEFVKFTKEYEVEVAFGIKTPSWDLETPSQLFSKPDKLRTRLLKLKKNQIETQLKQLIGETEIIVPPFSAVKAGGVRLYQLARCGRLDLSKVPKRKMKVYQARLLQFTPSKTLPNVLTPKVIFQKGPKAKIKFRVGKGVYIRSLIWKLGEDLGVGATVIRLVRTRIGPYRLSDCSSHQWGLTTTSSCK